MTAVSASLFSDKVRIVAPIIMGAACVNCHNTHPDSPKRDWKVGDVRGIQEVTISQPIAANIFSFKYLLGYFVFMAASGISFIGLQRRQAATIRGMNRELETANEFLAGLSMKISRYLSPQIYKSIFSGQKDVTIHTERKKLTIFFSDIKDFTAHHRAPAAGADHAAAQRIFHRDVEDRARTMAAPSTNSSATPC